MPIQKERSEIPCDFLKKITSFKSLYRAISLIEKKLVSQTLHTNGSEKLNYLLNRLMAIKKSAMPIDIFLLIFSFIRPSEVSAVDQFIQQQDFDRNYLENDLTLEIRLKMLLLNQLYYQYFSQAIFWKDCCLKVTVGSLQKLNLYRESKILLQNLYLAFEDVSLKKLQEITTKTPWRQIYRLNIFNMAQGTLKFKTLTDNSTFDNLKHLRLTNVEVDCDVFSKPWMARICELSLCDLKYTGSMKTETFNLNSLKHFEFCVYCAQNEQDFQLTLMVCKSILQSMKTNCLEHLKLSFPLGCESHPLSLDALFISAVNQAGSLQKVHFHLFPDALTNVQSFNYFVSCIRVGQFKYFHLKVHSVIEMSELMLLLSLHKLQYLCIISQFLSPPLLVSVNFAKLHTLWLVNVQYMLDEKLLSSGFCTNRLRQVNLSMNDKNAKQVLQLLRCHQDTLRSIRLTGESSCPSVYCETLVNTMKGIKNLFTLSVSHHLLDLQAITTLRQVVFKGRPHHLVFQ